MDVRRRLQVLPSIARTASRLIVALVALMGAGVGPSPCAAQPVTRAETGAPSTFGAWMPTGSLNTPRLLHSATLLPDGKVLVAGGIASPDSRPARSAELYDPATGTWTLTGSLGQPRAGHSATLLPDGRVLVAGGCQYDAFFVAYSCEAVELYDAGTGTWSATGSLAKPVVAGAASLLPSGQVLLVGGSNGLSGSSTQVYAQVYDPPRGTWSVINTLIVKRNDPSVAALQNGQVLTAGGTQDPDESVAISEAELLDLAPGKWKPAGSLNLARAGHTLTPLADGTVLATGGFVTAVGTIDFASVAELYDPARGTWVPAGRLNIGRMGHTATLLVNGQVLVAGGYAGGPTPTVVSGAEIYDPAGASWSSTASLHVGRSGHSATRLANGDVLVVGGMTGSGTTARILDSAELYEPGALRIGAGFTGSWYDPAQSGHGFQLEVLPGDPMQLLASWFTFAPQGGQAWIVGQGPIDGNRAVVQGIQTDGSGARFPPNFDATNVHVETWGTLTFTFSDCNHGRVEWASTAPGYGSGRLDLERLTLPAGLTCPSSGADAASASAAMP